MFSLFLSMYAGDLQHRSFAQMVFQHVRSAVSSIQSGVTTFCTELSECVNGDDFFGIPDEVDKAMVEALQTQKANFSSFPLATVDKNDTIHTTQPSN